MTISSKVKALLELKKTSQVDLAAHLGITKQALSNKFYRDSFSGSDLIKVADFLNSNLAFIVDEKQAIFFDSNDIRRE